MYAAGRGGYGRGGPPRGGFSGPGIGRGFPNGEEDGRVQTCYKCGGPNHFARDCHAKSVKCYACGKFEGHIVRLNQTFLADVSPGNVRTPHKDQRMVPLLQRFFQGRSTHNHLSCSPLF